MNQLDAAQTREELLKALERRDAREISVLAERLAWWELADVLPTLDHAQLDVLNDALGYEPIAEALGQLEPAIAARVLARLGSDEAADVLEEMPPDEATDVVGELTHPVREDLLARMQPAEAKDVRDLLGYPPDTAGGRMTPEFVSLRETMTVEEAIAHLRRVGARAELLYYVYVVDDAGRLTGVVTLRDLLMSPPSRRISEVTKVDVISVSASDDQEKAARLLRQSGLLALPVVGPNRTLLGIISADDAVAVLEGEATEDMFHMAGIGVRERATSPVIESSRRRVPWLAFNMAWSLGSAFVVSRFTGTIEMAPVLAVFMPVITGQAGNAGIQTATIVIRSLALGDVAPRDVGPVLLREWAVGAIKGGTFGVLLGLIAWIWFGNAILGIIAGAALFLNIAVVASTTGVLLPMTLSRIGLDPATIAGVFDTMLSDLMGNLIYLGLATLLLSRLLQS